MAMLTSLESRILPYGLVVFSDDIIKTLKINKNHFEKNRP